jgi:hypothetical protein
LAETGKSNKKQIKFLKAAEKDHSDFQGKKIPEVKIERYCK